MDEEYRFSAPGRVEIGGNHTDHQHGRVLAAAINLESKAIVRRNCEGKIRVISEGYEPVEIDVWDLGVHEEEKNTTAALIRGVASAFTECGCKLGGLDAKVSSAVLPGSGLSSSAAFEVLIGRILNGLFFEDKLTPVQIAQIGQYAENVYFGKPCGLMDQIACSVGNLVHIDFADVKNPKVEKVAFDMNAYGYSLCITDTKGSHADLTADYAAIPTEMKAVASYFGKEVLLGLTIEDILSHAQELREKLGDRAVLRALHFLCEDVRVEEEIDALKAGNIDAFLQKVKESGDSSFKYLQNVYTSHDVMHQNVSLALAVSEIALAGGAGVARVHGGGFAGTIQAFVKNEAVSGYRAAMDRLFGADACKVLKIRKYGGMKVLA